MKKLVSVILILATLVGILSSCGGSPDRNYFTKGDFYTLVMSEMNFYPIDAEWEDMSEDDEYKIASKSMVDWGLLPEKEASKNPLKPVTKEIALLILVNSLGIIKKGNPEDIKDISMTKYPEEISNAVASGIAETDEKGYLNLGQKLTYDECVALIEKTNEVEANSHIAEEDFYYGYDFGENSVVLNDLEIPEDESIDIVGYEQANEAVNSKVSSLGSFEEPNVEYVGLANGSPETKDVLFNSTFSVFVSDRVYNLIFKNKDKKVSAKKGSVIVYDATLSNYEYRDKNYKHNESNKGSYNFHDSVLDWNIDGASYDLKEENKSFAGRLVSDPEYVNVNLNGERCKRWKIHMEAIDDQEKMACTDINVSDYLKKLDFKGKKLEFNGITITPEVDENTGAFTVKLEKKFNESLSINPNNPNEINNYNGTFTYTYTVSNFRANISNVKYFFRKDSPKDGKPLTKVTWDTDEEIKYTTDTMKLSPYNSGNGGAVANIKKALKGGLKSTTSKGASSIKLYDFSCSIPQAGMTFVFYVLLTFEIDGSLKISISRGENGFQFKKQGKHTTFEKLSSKEKKRDVELQVNFMAQLEIEVTMLFALTLTKPVITAFAGVRLSGTAIFNMYDENDVKEGESLTGGDNGIVVQAAKSSGGGWKYCLDIHGQLSFVGGLKQKPAIKSTKFSGGESLLYTVLDKFGVPMSKLVFSFPIGDPIEKHYEESSEKSLDHCTRHAEEKESDEQKKLNNQAKQQRAFIVEVTKINLNQQSVGADPIIGWPVTEAKINKEYKGGVVVASKNEKICEAWYDEDAKTIMIYGKGVGSTEVEVYIHKYEGKIWNRTEKQFYKQTISVTVDGYENVNVNYPVSFNPDAILHL